MAISVDPPIERVLQWCHRALGTLTERGAVVRVELVVAREDGSAGAGADRIETIQIADGRPSPEDLAQILSDAARAEAEAAITATKLRFLAFAFDDPSPRAEPVTRLSFVLDALPRANRYGETMPRGGGNATDLGVTALVRGATATLETVMGRMDQALGTLQKQNETLAARLAESQQIMFNQQQALMSIVSDQKAQELEHIKVTMTERRKQQTFDALLGLAPMLLAQAKAGTPAAALIASRAKDPVRMGLSQLIKSMDQETMMKLMDSFNPEQQAILAQLVTVVGAEYEAEQKNLPPDPTKEP